MSPTINYPFHSRIRLTKGTIGLYGYIYKRYNRMSDSDDITNLDGITENSVEYFEEEGYSSISDFEGIELDDLMEVKYMQEDRAEKILESAEELIEKESNEDLIYNPATDEYLEEEPENYVCNCGASFPDKSVYLAHENLCREA